MTRFFNISNKWRFVIAMALGVASNYCLAAADCRITAGAGQQANVTLQSLTAASNGEANTVLGQQEIPINTISYTCGAAIESQWASQLRSGSALTQSSNVWSTNVQGVGFRIKWPASRNGAYWPTTYRCNGNCSESADKLTVEFVQTGKVAAGTIPAGELGKANLVAFSTTSNTASMLTVTLMYPIDIVVKSCSVRAEPANIDFGHNAIEDVRNNKTKKTSFKMLINCPDQAKVKLQFDGPAVFGGMNGVVKNINGTAKGVGVRLTDAQGMAAVNIAGQQRELGSISGAKEYTYNSQLYAYGTETLTAGDVDTYVTFTLTMY